MLNNILNALMLEALYIGFVLAVTGTLIVLGARRFPVAAPRIGCFLHRRLIARPVIAVVSE